LQRAQNSQSPTSFPTTASPLLLLLLLVLLVVVVVVDSHCRPSWCYRCRCNSRSNGPSTHIPVSLGL
jgi:hypothetical protein